MQNSASEIIEQLKLSNNVIICMDSRVDYDALGSAAIMRGYLVDKLGKNVTVTLDDGISGSIKELAEKYTDISFIKQEIKPATDIDFSLYDTQIFLDSGNLEHISKTMEFKLVEGIRTINIDHHASNTLFGEYNFVKNYGSTCTVLFSMFREADIDIDMKFGETYFLATLFDTMFFKNAATTYMDYEMIAYLVKNGVDNYKIMYDLSNNESLDNMKLKGLVYTNLRVVPKRKIAYSTITKQDLKTHKIELDEATAVPSNLISTLENMDFVFVVREKDSNIYSLSFRSHHKDFNVLRLAEKLNGGGHNMAAGGAVTADSLDDAITQVLYLAQKLEEEK